MDKFGIFKLLTTIFGNLNNSSENPMKSTTTNSETNGADLLKGIENFFTTQKNNASSSAETQTYKEDFSKYPQKTATLKQPLKAPPLNQMLYTMRNHDEIVNRVKNSNNKKL